jgi:hypothetical protein
MELTGWYVIVPFRLASLISGVIQGVGTKWGLPSYCWALYKLLITVVRPSSYSDLPKRLPALGALAGDATVSVDILRDPSPVVHSGLAVPALFITTILSVYKPWGETRFFGGATSEGQSSGQTQSEVTESI